MITLHSFGAGLGMPDPSPFVLKIDTYLRMAGLEYNTVADLSNLQKAPKGKLPFIHDDGKVIADSFFIIEHLTEKYDVQLDAWLSKEQQAMSHLIAKSVEENLYWCLVYSRWIREDTWPTISKSFFGSMPFPLKQLAPNIARSGVKSALKKQGLGRHSNEEIQEILKQSLDSLSTLLGSNSYFFGEKICSLDATLFGFLSQFILAQINNPFNQLARSYDNLAHYCQRIHGAFYPYSTEVKAA